MTRPTWDEVRLQMAQEIAKRSLCTKAKVGAIITGPDGKHMVGEGYNGPPAGWMHGTQPCNVWCKRTNTPTPAPDYSDCTTIHAEANALLKSDYTARTGGTIYVTSHPCWGCAKLIANSGLARVVVQPDAAHLHRDPMASYRFLIECGLQVTVQDQVIMSRLSRLQNYFLGGIPEPEPPYLVQRFKDEPTRREQMPNPAAGQISWREDEKTPEVFDGREWKTMTAYPSRLVD